MARDASRPNEKKRVIPVEEGRSLLDLNTPGMQDGSAMGMGMGVSRSLSTQTPPQLGKLDFSGPPMHLLPNLEMSLDFPPTAVCVPDAAGVGGGAPKTLPPSYPALQSSGTSSDAEDSFNLRRYLRAGDER